MLSFSYSRTLQGLELKVRGLRLELDSDPVDSDLVDSTTSLVID